jgi:flavodoxin
MRVLIVYDSTYGHTERIAQAIGEAIDGEVRHVSAVSPADLEGFDLLIIGSPTHGGFPTEGIHELVKGAPAVDGVAVAAFDTRTKRTIFGYAAPKIARSMEGSGGILVTPPEGFLVEGKKGPLKDGELERAADWATQVGAAG